MSVGGTIVDIVRRSPERWWINTLDRHELPSIERTVAVWCNPKGESIDVGDSFWWQGGSCYWTPQDRSRQDVELPKIGFSMPGTQHPDRRKKGSPS